MYSDSALPWSLFQILYWMFSQDQSLNARNKTIISWVSPHWSWVRSVRLWRGKFRINYKHSIQGKFYRCMPWWIRINVVLSSWKTTACPRTVGFIYNAACSTINLLRLKWNLSPKTNWTKLYLELEPCLNLFML